MNQSDHHHPGTHHPLHCIIPPHMLEELARNGTEHERQVAEATLALDAVVRAQRTDTGPAADGPPAGSEGARHGLLAPPAPVDVVEAPEADSAGSVEAASAPRKDRRIHDAKHRTTLPGTLVRKEGDGPSGDVDVDRVYDGFGATWDLFFDVYGRNSYDNDGATLTGSVHYRRNYNNAFWNGEQMAFGDGDGTRFVSFTAAIDVMGHELTHAVTSSESNLKYENQSGALNEHLSDVFGSLVKQRAATPPQTANQADWLIGAGLFGPTVNGVALRSMIAPGTAYNDPVLGKDPQPDHMSNYVQTTDDNGGVHINSGIPNRAFALFAIALGGFAWEKAGRVWYAAAIDDELDSKAEFAEFAALTADHAYALFGHDVAKACVDAWATVGISVPWNRHVDRTAQHGAPTAVGVPTACVFPGLGVENIAYRDGNGHLHELWRDAAGGTGTSDLTALAGAPTAAGDPFAYADHLRNTEILLFRSGDNRVRSLYWSTGPVGHDDLSGTAGSPPAAGTPVGYHHAPADAHHVIYRGTDSHLHELVWFGVAPVFYGGNLTGAIGAPRAQGDPAAYSLPDGTNIVPYRAVDGRILSVYWNDGPSGLDDLSGTAGAPPAASDPVAFYTAHNDTHQIVYRAVDGHLWELYWVGVAPVAGWNLTAAAGAPPPVGKPTAFYSPTYNVKSVVYRRSDGHLHELWWVPGSGAPSHGDVTANSTAPNAADSPTAFYVPGDRAGHIAYRAGDNHIHEISWR